MATHYPTARRSGDPSAVHFSKNAYAQATLTAGGLRI